MSLARLWRVQDKCHDAYDLLAPVYGWFTEGFDTTDLQDTIGNETQETGCDSTTLRSLVKTLSNGSPNGKHDQNGSGTVVEEKTVLSDRAISRRHPREL